MGVERRTLDTVNNCKKEMVKIPLQQSPHSLYRFPLPLPSILVRWYPQETGEAIQRVSTPETRNTCKKKNSTVWLVLKRVRCCRGNSLLMRVRERQREAKGGKERIEEAQRILTRKGRNVFEAVNF